MADRLSERVKEALSMVISTEDNPPVMDKPKLKRLVEEMTAEEWTQFNKVYQLLSFGAYIGDVPKEEMEGFFRDE